MSTTKERLARRKYMGLWSECQTNGQDDEQVSNQCDGVNEQERMKKKSSCS